MGITSFIDPVPSVFLGTAEITVKEMVAAYSIFANKGVYNSPLPVYRIEDKYGNVLQEFRPESREVITENTAYLMCNLLEGVVTGGTGVRLRYKYKLMNPMGERPVPPKSMPMVGLWVLLPTWSVAFGLEQKIVPSISKIWLMDRELVWPYLFGLNFC